MGIDIDGTLVMIDIEAAQAAMARISVGDVIDVILDGVTRSLKVVDLTSYSVTLQGPTNRIGVPIEATQFYKDEITMRVPATTSDKPKKAGRPPKGTPPEHPKQQQPADDTPPGGWLAPSDHTPASPGVGSFQMEQPPTPPVTAPMQPVQQPVQQAPAVVAPVKATQPATPPRQVTIQEAEGDPNWIETALDEGLDVVRELFSTLIEGVKRQSATGELPATTKAPMDRAYPPTCWNCVYVNKTVGNCSKFGTVPMHVIVDPKAHCEAFINDDEDIPF